MVIQPIIIHNFIKYFNDQIDFKWAVIYGTCFFLCTAINNLCHHPFFFNLLRKGMRMRIAVSGLVYRKACKAYFYFIFKFQNSIIFKALKLNLMNLEKDANGKIINILSNDVSRIESAFYFFPYFFISPLQTIVIVLILFKMVDLSILSGITLLVLVIPLQSCFGKLQNIYK